MLISLTNRIVSSIGLFRNGGFKVQVAGCGRRMQDAVAGRGCRSSLNRGLIFSADIVILFTTLDRFFCRHRVWRLSSSKTLIGMFIVIFRPLVFNSAKFYISQNSLQSPDI